MPKRLTKEEFIEKAIRVHEDRFDYSKVDYIDSKTKVTIICKEHGEFRQIPNSHLLGKNGCPECYKIALRQIKRKDKDTFISEANLVHENKYNYSMVEYVNSETNITIICPEHGEFQTTPNHHLHMKVGCPICGRLERIKAHMITKEEFINKGIAKFGNKFDYSYINYVDYDTPVKIKCSEHGFFEMKPSVHVRTKTGCQECARKNVRNSLMLMNTETFIEKSQEIHEDKYDYSETQYKSYKLRVKIKCKEHGFFELLPFSHLNGYGCPLCLQKENADTEERLHLRLSERKQKNKHIAKKREFSKSLLSEYGKRIYTKEEFIFLAKQIHGEDYSYEYVEYVNMNTPVIIYCNEHRWKFGQKPINHLAGQGCPKCIGRNKTTEDFISEAKSIHGNRYIYDAVEYKGTLQKVKIECPIHGIFEQTPSKHLSGRGCPICKISYLERSVLSFLEKNTDLEIESQKCFDWLRIKKKMPLDIYIPKYKVAIECQGEQHFRETTLYGTNGAFSKQQSKDLLKYRLCKEHGIRILYFADKRYEIPKKYIDVIYTEFEELLKAIQGN